MVDTWDSEPWIQGATLRVYLTPRIDDAGYGVQHYPSICNQLFACALSWYAKCFTVEHMNQIINVSGAYGGGSSVKIYETPEYSWPWHGALIMHGSYTVGPGSPDNQRIEIVELHLPGIDIRVSADSVRNELRALLAANKASEIACYSAESQPARHQAFSQLQAAVFSRTASVITVGHIEKIAQEAYKDGVEHGETLMRSRFRSLLKL